jgi:hypothetical protein
MWVAAEDLGFDAVSVWDHLYSSDLATYECHEAVAMHAAGLRHQPGAAAACLLRRLPPPSVLASHRDHRPPVGGREWPRGGVGAGQCDVRVPVPAPGDRLDLLAESRPPSAAAARRRHQPLQPPRPARRRATEPPLQPDLPVWIGGTAAPRGASWPWRRLEPAVRGRRCGRQAPRSPPTAQRWGDPSEVRRASASSCATTTPAPRFGRAPMCSPRCRVGTSVEATAQAWAAASGWRRHRERGAAPRGTLEAPGWSRVAALR